MSTNGNERLARWQGLTIAQFSQVTSVALGLAVATLGFDAALLTSEKFMPVSWQKCAFGFALLSLLVSVGAGIWCAINRLRDFRTTTAVARDYQKGEATDIEANRKLVSDFGKFTWVLLWWQIGTFATGILATVVVVGAVYGARLL